MLFVVRITSAGALPPLLRSQAHHQPLAGNRSESRWVTTLREGESGAYHVSKVDREALRSTRRMRSDTERMKNISAVWSVREGTFLPSAVMVMILRLWQFDTVHHLTWITLQQHEIMSSRVTHRFSLFFLLLFRKMFSPKWICASVGPTRSSLCQGCKTFEFSALLVLQ